MANSKFDRVPRFSELPVRPDAPAESSWGVFGENDELGCLNFLSATGVVEAARLVTKGRIFRLDTPLNYADPPLFGRAPVRHTILSYESFGVLALDDQLDNYNTQEGSQWDGLRHIGHVRHRTFYNGVPRDEIKPGEGRLGIDRWAGRLVGRGLLLDVFKYRAEQGRPVDPLTSETYPLDDLTATLAATRLAFRPGTILLVRTGWMQAYLSASPERKRAMASIFELKACGLESSRELMEWLWNNRVAALASDCPAVEQWPWNFSDEGALHYRALSLLGLPLGEQFDLEELAADCAADDVYEFMLVSVPLNIRGGVASPPNAVAIK